MTLDQALIRIATLEGDLEFTRQNTRQLIADLSAARDALTSDNAALRTHLAYSGW